MVEFCQLCFKEMMMTSHNRAARLWPDMIIGKSDAATQLTTPDT